MTSITTTTAVISRAARRSTPTSVDPLAFKELYADCGYDDAIAKFDEGGSQGGSLSYVVRPAKGVTLIVIDSGKYSADQNGLGRDEHVTSGCGGGEAARVGGEPGQQARAPGISCS